MQSVARVPVTDGAARAGAKLAQRGKVSAGQPARRPMNSGRSRLDCASCGTTKHMHASFISGYNLRNTAPQSSGFSSWDFSTSVPTPSTPLLHSQKGKSHIHKHQVRAFVPSQLSSVTVISIYCGGKTAPAS